MSRSTMFGTMMALALAGAFVAGSAAAQTMTAACKADIEKVCPGLMPGDGKYGQCLVDHKSDLSAPCKKFSDAAAARKADLKNLPSCLADAEKLCPTVKPSLTGLTKCLRLHETDLSSECRQEIRKRTGSYH